MALAMVWIFFRIIQLPLACTLNLLNKQTTHHRPQTKKKKREENKKTTTTTTKKKKKAVKKKTQIGTAIFMFYSDFLE